VVGQFLGKEGFVLFVACAVFLLLFPDLVAFIERPGQIARHFDIDRHRRAIAADDGVDHLACLVQCPQHDRVARDVLVFGKAHATVRVAPGVERRQGARGAFAGFVQLAVVVADLDRRFVIAQACFHVRHDLVERLQRQGVEFVEADVEQGLDHCLPVWQGQSVQFRAGFVIVLVDAEHTGNFVQNLRLTATGGTGESFPLGFESGGLERGA
jgi:hypothetical protein